MTMAEKEPKKYGTKEVAAKLKIAPATLRRWLRQKGKGGSAEEYARYEYTQEQMDKLIAAYTKDQASSSKSSAKETKKDDSKKGKTSSKKTSKKGAGKKEAPASESDDEIEEFEG